MRSLATITINMVNVQLRLKNMGLLIYSFHSPLPPCVKYEVRAFRLKSMSVLGRFPSELRILVKVWYVMPVAFMQIQEI